MKQNLLSRLRSEDNGVAAIEFALIFPLLMLTIFGCAELVCQLYLRSNMHMVIRQAARDSIVGTANMEAIESKLRRQLEILPGVYKGTQLVISICQQSGCGARTVMVSELTGDTDNDGVCDPGEKYTDKNRNGIPEKAGTLVTGNSLGGPNDPVIFEVKAKARFFFGSLSFLGKIPAAKQIVNFTVSAVGTNEDFKQDEQDCPS